jgi:hypothetical protein
MFIQVSPLRSHCSRYEKKGDRSGFIFPGAAECNEASRRGVSMVSSVLGAGMKYVSAVVLSLVLSVGAFGQRRGGMAGGMRGGSGGGGHWGGGGQRSGGTVFSNAPLGVVGVVPYRTFGSFAGFGNVLFPGTGNQPPIVTPFDFPSTFANRLAVTVGGFRGGTLGVSSPFGFGFDPQAFGATFGYATPGVGPYYYGYGGGYPIPYPVPAGGDYGYPPQQPNVTVVMPPQGQPSSPVTINQNFGQGAAPDTIAEAAQPASSGVTVYQAPSPASVAPARNDQPVFLIALKDTTVYPAVGYWVEGDALHYITPQGKHNQVSLGLVDRKTSARLNSGNQIDFHLPPG